MHWQLFAIQLSINVGYNKFGLIRHLIDSRLVANACFEQLKPSLSLHNREPVFIPTYETIKFVEPPLCEVAFGVHEKQNIDVCLAKAELCLVVLSDNPPIF